MYRKQNGAKFFEKYFNEIKFYFDRLNLELN